MPVGHWLENLPSELAYGVATSIVVGAGAWGYHRLRRGHVAAEVREFGASAVGGAPRSLPRAPPRLVNRERELAMLDDTLARARLSAAVQVAVVSGMRGVGKSAVGSAWAHRNLSEFSGGALTADFSRRRNPAGISVSDILADFLQELGTSELAMPATFAERKRLFERITTGRRMLIVLDDVDLPTQAIDMFPAGSGSVVLVTSAHPLEELVRGGAQPVIVDPLEETAALELLIEMTSRERIENEPDATLAVLRACGGLPIALCVCGARLATHPARSVEWLARQLQAQQRLQTLSPPGEFNATAVFTSAYHDLSQGEATLYRRLAAHPGPDFAAAAAAAAAGLELGVTVGLVGRLEDAYLLQPEADDRHRPHELVRQHMRMCAGEELEANIGSATVRVIDWYTAAARAADHAVTDERLRLGESARVPAQNLPALKEPREAFAWFAVERHNVLAAQQEALRRELFERVWQIAEALWPLCASHKRFTEWIDSHKAAIEAGEALQDERVIARMRSQLARAYAELADHKAARTEMALAIGAVRRTGDGRLAASVVEFDGVCRLRAGQYREALTAFGEAREGFQACGVERGVALQDYHIGWCLILAGDEQLALEPLGRAERAMRQIGDQINVGRALLREGEALTHLGRVEPAREALERALVALEDAGVEFEQAETHEALAALAEGHGDPVQARVHRQRAYRLYRQLGHPRAEELARFPQPADSV